MFRVWIPIRQIAWPNAGIGVDMLHLVRTGGSSADVAAVAPALLRYAQICDGANLAATSDYFTEAIGGRLIPGEGCFPILDIIEALPRAIALDVEVPSISMQSRGVPALERARRAVTASRRLIEAAKPTR